MRLLRDGGAANVPRPHRDHAGRRLRARAAVDGVRARLRDLRPLLRLSDRARRGRAERDARRAAGARVPALRATRTSPTRRAGGCCSRSATTRPATTTAASCSSGPTGSCGWRPATAADGANAQDPASLLGKLIRLDPAAPTPEVVASGLRNPWRFSFDRATGQLVLADVGHGAFEEINVGLAGNYGWPCFEGTARRTLRPRLRQRDGAAGPDQGPHDRRVLLDHRRLRRARPRPADAARPLPVRGLLRGRAAHGRPRAPAGDAATGLRASNPSSFGEDACGRLLVVSLNGPVYRLLDGAPSACAPTAPPPAPSAPTPVATRAPAPCPRA